MDAAWGMALLHNTSALANPLSDDLWNTQVHSNDSHHKVLSRSKRGVGTVIAIGSLIGALVGGVSLGVRAIPEEYTRNFQMHLENNLEYSLQNPKSVVWWGHISKAPTRVQSCTASLVTGHKAAYSATGTSGIASWRIQEQNLTIIIFWDVPFSSGCNSLGLGIYTDLPITEPSANRRDDYISDLFYNHILIPDSGEYMYRTAVNLASCNSANEFCTTNKGIRVCGVMSTNSAAHIRVRIEHKDNDTHCSGNQ
ncbi:unnamed protein product [Meganyctiphanes norvegica]|uniref:Uncharacterized protein n=1 Tax=Meganyctiphanes norvegica TaxID=48144 RepID=A0AAV2S612_MEGNR